LENRRVRLNRAQYRRAKFKDLSRQSGEVLVRGPKRAFSPSEATQFRGRERAAED
jgi:hypothetical protein